MPGRLYNNRVREAKAFADGVDGLDNNHTDGSPCHLAHDAGAAAVSASDFSEDAGSDRCSPVVPDPVNG